MLRGVAILGRMAVRVLGPRPIRPIPDAMRAPALLSLVAYAAASCLTTETRRHLSSTATPEVRVGALTRVWEIYSGDELAGRIVLFQAQGAARDSVYTVRNPWQQDIGLIDGLGRAYRYVPHQREPSWVGSGTVAQGVERILGLASPCRLVEVASPAPDSPAPADERTPSGTTNPTPGALPAGSEHASADEGFAQSR